MDLKQLVALVTVADLGSVSAAARVLHLVQPAVSRQIRALETEVGAPLFERTRTGMLPTDLGLELLDHARRALAEIDRAEALARRDAATFSGTVTVGLLESVVGQLATPFAQAVRTAYPRVDLRILSGFSGHLRDWLASGAVDMSLLYSLAGDSGDRQATPLVVESLWALAPPGAGLAPENPVPWAALGGQTLVLPARGHGLRALVDLGLAGSVAPPDVALETNSMQVQKEFVRAGLGWSVLPAVGVARDVADGSLSAAPLTSPAISRTVTLAMARARSAAVVGAVGQELVVTVARLVEKGAWPGRVVWPGDVREGR